MRISNDDMTSLVIGHAAGAHNRFEGCISSPGRGSRRKSRKPRPSKRARLRSFTVP
jgi:transcriptional antiterminator NusG